MLTSKSFTEFVIKSYIILIVYHTKYIIIYDYFLHKFLELFCKCFIDAKLKAHDTYVPETWEQSPVVQRTGKRSSSSGIQKRCLNQGVFRLLN